MSALRTILAEILGLFVDDGSLALAILMLIGLVAILAAAHVASPWLPGAILFGGLIAILGENLLRSARKY